MTPDNPAPDETGTTRSRLAKAAADEFKEGGFYGTDTNRIARRAGFAPQTFYRHFADKTDMFIHVYQAWQASERRQMLHLLRGYDTHRARRNSALAGALIAHHREWRHFRRSLRLLALEDDRVRTARAESRRAQLLALDALTGGDVASWPERFADLLAVERLCDAAADDEIGDLGILPAEWKHRVAHAVGQLVGRRG